MGRTTSWTHFGMAIVGENMFTNVLSLQDMKHVSLPGFNKAFDDAVKIINNNVQNNAFFMSVHLSYPVVFCYFTECWVRVEFDREKAKTFEQHLFCIAKYNQTVQSKA